MLLKIKDRDGKASNEAGMFMKIKAVTLLIGNVAENTSG